ncbi:hypothetical protein [Zunongwangia endophytica]|uniref:Uncharacterized protein n=1 Tax=Zunongwangia endophytica TaxID=1808945 RepID=A0ABV8H3B5_9FLAO|nr:hypothetical protein [Zunongwangia endophytica]MDN3596144.1 hypothetical protein [Zunongwangia endophytica]
MTKYLIYTIIFLGIVVIGFNITILDFSSHIMEDESGGALIAIIASLCVIVLMGILLVSRAIAKKHSS